MRHTTTRFAVASLAVCLAAAACTGESDTMDDRTAEMPEAMAATADTLFDADLDQTAYGFDDIDMDGDSELDADEFHEWSEGPVLAFYMSPMRDESEPDATGALDREVLVDALFRAWDVDRDGGLDAMEWDQASNVIEALSDTTVAWIEFDIDGNSRVDLAEVSTRIDRDVVLKAIDADQNGSIEEMELNRWFFALFDVDNDGSVDRDEWRLAELYLDVPTL